MNNKKLRNRGKVSIKIPSLKVKGTIKLTNTKKGIRIIDSARSKYNPVLCKLAGKR